MHNPFESRHAPPPHLLLLLWLILTGLVIFGSAVIVDQGLLQEMLAADRSQICLVVMAMYFIGLGQTFIRTRALSQELQAAETLVSRLEQGGPHAGTLDISPEAVRLADGQAVPAGFLCNYLREHFGRRGHAAADGEGGGELLEAYASKVRATTEFGWFFIDLMLKVGFLGTLVGFILMLSSVADTGTLDATTMQKVLTQMSVGMSTALYTTLASLVGGILLSIPYYLHDRGLERLLQLTVQARDVLVPPRLRGGG
ncbi:MAG: MotA/TolQ/ExbB proton channel family protein [Gammaproteobacteria bacterium]|nr:MotA/TolQ/ExbB proton channel family protein [Gammaproteobacteria bacterium]